MTTYQNLKLIFFIFLFSIGLTGKVCASFQGHPKILIKTPHISPSEFHAQVILNQRDSVTYSNWLRQQLPSPKEREKLLDLFELAQSLYLTSSLDEARLKWKLVASNSLNQDWDENSRKIISNSLMRLAQISYDDTQKKNFVLKSIAFDPGFNPSPQLYPPHLIKMYEDQLKSADLYETIYLRPKLRDFDKILINGKSVESPQAQLVRGEQFRLTLLSNEYARQVTILNTEEYQAWEPSKMALVSGPCENLKINKDLILNSNPNLELTPLQSGLRCAPEETTPYNLTSISTSPKNSPIEKTMAPKPEDKFHLTRNQKWFMGVGLAVAGAYLYHLNNKDGQGRTPTTKEGF